MKKIIKFDGCSGICPYRLYMYFQFPPVDRCSFYDMEIDQEKFSRRLGHETKEKKFPQFCEVRKITIEGGKYGLSIM